MNKITACLAAISTLLITACQSTPEPVVVVKPFFPDPPRALMEEPAELSSIDKEDTN